MAAVLVSSYTGPIVKWNMFVCTVTMAILVHHRVYGMAAICKWNGKMRLKALLRYKLMGNHSIQRSGCSLGWLLKHCDLTNNTADIHFPSDCPPTSSEGLELRDDVALLTRDVESCKGSNPLSRK
jgi:hypothetical protein